MEQTNTHEPQQQAAPPPAPPLSLPRRSPGLALVLSFFPGLGHLYLGLYQRGIAIFLAFAASIWLADHGDLGILIPFVWFFGVIDAYRQAQFQMVGGVVEEPAVPVKTRKSNLGFGVFLLVLGVILLYNQFYPLDFTFLVDWWPLALIAFGAYILGKHFFEQKKVRDAEAKVREEEWNNPA